MVVGVHVGPDVLRADHLCYPYQLVVVVCALEERFLGEHHTGEHAASGPDIELVVVVVVT